MMAMLHQIDVHGIRLYSNHGCMQEEAIIGSHYEVNISVWANLSVSVQTDELIDTVDYVALYEITKSEMGKRAKLLEVVCQRIMHRIMDEHWVAKPRRRDLPSDLHRGERRRSCGWLSTPQG